MRSLYNCSGHFSHYAIPIWISCVRKPNESNFAKTTGLYSSYRLKMGLTVNPDHPENGFNEPVTFNDRNREVQLSQFYVAV